MSFRLWDTDFVFTIPVIFIECILIIDFLILTVLLLVTDLLLLVILFFGKYTITFKMC